MTPERYRQVKRAFLAVCEVSCEEQSTSLDQLCDGDTELRKELDELLQHDSADSMNPLDALQRNQALASSDPPAIDGFQIRGLIDQGGMGLVYEADQENPRRTVAIKILGSTFVSENTVSRFKLEAELLGQLQHPGIAQIVQAGTYGIGPDERPFIAMEFIDGSPLRQHIQNTPLSLRDKLDLLIRVCQAVNHAHQRGIIHRDINPGNVMVTGEGDPKVIDFGIARFAADERDQRDGQYTREGDLLGTLPYMSPEQVTGRRADIDVRTDVYALGALCYEVLTGRLPIDLRGKSLSEQVNDIQERTPAPLGDHDSALKGDLEIILAKALSKDRNLRYGSAQEFADDLQRFLRHEPITARRAGYWYHLRKFSQRHRAVVVAGSLSVLALIVGLAGTGLGLRRARQRLAESYLQQARLETQRGKWATAIRTYNRSLQNGQPDSVQLHLERVAAHLAVNRLDRADKLLKRAAKMPDADQHRGSILLWQAEVLLSRWEDVEKAKTLVQQALKRQLGEVEIAFAKGLLAESLAESISHFKAAVDRDASFHRAHLYLIYSLVLIGKHEEAFERLAVAEVHVSQDPNLVFLRSLATTIRNQPEEGRKLLKSIEDQFSSEQYLLAQQIAKALHHWFHPQLSTADPYDAMDQVLIRQIALGNDVRAAIKSVREAPRRVGRLVAVPPSIAVHARFAQDALTDLAAEKPLTGVIRRIEKILSEQQLLDAVEQPPTVGLLAYFAGILTHLDMTLTHQVRTDDPSWWEKTRPTWIKIERYFGTAAPSVSIPPLRRHALYALLDAQRLMSGARSPLKSSALRDRTRRNLRQFFAAYPSPRQSEVKMLSKLALDLEEFDVARAYLRLWEATSGNEPQLLRARLRLEEHDANHLAIVATTTRLLRAQPENEEWARRRREAFLEGLLTFGRAFATPSPAASK